jgi:hypothetical protein
MQLADATKLKGVVITSSPASIPAAMTHKCKAVVPLDTATAWRTPTNAATRLSNSSILGPILRCGVCNTATTASISFWLISGADIGILVMLTALLG